MDGWIHAPSFVPHPLLPLVTATQTQDKAAAQQTRTVSLAEAAAEAAENAKEAEALDAALQEASEQRDAVTAVGEEARGLLLVAEAAARAGQEVRWGGKCDC